MDLGKMMNDGFNKISKSVGDEFKRIGREAEENWNNDINQIDRGIKNGGLLGGLVETADVFSPGHQSAQWLDNFNVIPDDEGIKNGISAGVNFGVGLAITAATGGSAGIVMLPAAALAAKDIADMVSQPGVPMAPAQSTPSPRQAYEQRMCGASSCDHVTPGSKKDALKAAKRAAREEAVDAARELAKQKRADQRDHALDVIKARRSGYAEGFEDGIEAATGGLCTDILELLKRLRDRFGKDKTDDATSEIDKILSNPNLCFEDMIFLLLRAIMKDGQAEAKQLAKELRDDRKEELGLKKALNDDIAEVQAKLGSATDPNERQNLQNELNTLKEKKAELLSERAESRADIGESLKNLMQKLSEMQQAMSNILNAQHESAMAAIRNIR